MFWTLNPAVSAETQVVCFFFFPGCFLIQISHCLLCGYTTQQPHLFTAVDPLYMFTSSADRVISGQVLQPNTLNFKDPKLRNWSKFPWSANAAWVPVVSVSTCSGRGRNFHAAGERCQQSEATFNAVATAVHSTPLSISAPSPLRVWRYETNSFCMFRVWTLLEVNNHMSNAIRCLCLSLLYWSWQWATDLCMRRSTPCGVWPSLITLFTSAFVNLPCWMLSEALTNVHATSPGTLPAAVKILLERYLRKNV